jgi:methionine-S-sulfoxide reductase
MRTKGWIAVAVLVAGGAAVALKGVTPAGGNVTPRTPYGRTHPAARTETATFAAGCFWKLEHTMRGIDGVVSTTAGYTGGEAESSSHAAVAGGRTGHAEAVRVAFDPSAVSYGRLLEAFWKSHDPSQFTPDPFEPSPPGRSAVFYHSDAQRAAAEQARQRLGVATEILPAGPFHPAEAEHQQYLERHGAAGSCALR